MPFDVSKYWPNPKAGKVQRFIYKSATYHSAKGVGPIEIRWMSQDANGKRVQAFPVGVDAIIESPSP